MTLKHILTTYKMNLFQYSRPARKNLMQLNKQQLLMKSDGQEKFLLCLCNFKEQDKTSTRYQPSQMRLIIKNRLSRSRSFFFSNKSSSFRIKSLPANFQNQGKQFLLKIPLITSRKDWKLLNHIFNLLKMNLAVN